MYSKLQNVGMWIEGDLWWFCFFLVSGSEDVIIPRSRSDLSTLGPKIGITYLLGGYVATGLAISLEFGRHLPSLLRSRKKEAGSVVFRLLRSDGRCRPNSKEIARPVAT